MGVYSLMWRGGVVRDGEVTRGRRILANIMDIRDRRVWTETVDYSRENVYSIHERALLKSSYCR